MVGWWWRRRWRRRERKQRAGHHAAGSEVDAGSCQFIEALVYQEDLAERFVVIGSPVRTLHGLMCFDSVIEEQSPFGAPNI
jgi:hypothetical protein